MTDIAPMKNKIVIARYFSTEKAAVRKANELKRMWQGRIGWFVIRAKNGYFVISETSAKKLYPELFKGYSYRSRAYNPPLEAKFATKVKS